MITKKFEKKIANGGQVEIVVGGERGEHSLQQSTRTDRSRLNTSEQISYKILKKQRYLAFCQID
jgi:hypothetical protein